MPIVRHEASGRPSFVTFLNRLLSQNLSDRPSAESVILPGLGARPIQIPASGLSTAGFATDVLEGANPPHVSVQSRLPLAFIPPARSPCDFRPSLFEKHLLGLR